MWPGRNNVPFVFGIRSRYKENSAVKPGISTILTA